LQQIYRVIANRFFIKIDNNNNIITINNNLVITKTKQLIIINIKNCFYFININIKSLVFNISRIVFRKDINRYIVFIQYLINIYILKTKYICLYIRD